MANVKETAKSILKKCRDETFNTEDIDNEWPLDESFVDHLWSERFEKDRNDILHDYFIVSKRSGIVRLEMSTTINNENSAWYLLAKFHFGYLTIDQIAAAIDAIIENT